MAESPALTRAEAQIQAPLPESPVLVGSTRMSAEEFLRWEHPGIAEWINEQVIVMSVKEEHQRVLQFLYELLAPFIRLFKLGTVRLAPYAMRITPDGPMREPDIAFISSANTLRITSNLLEGPADLVIEVASEGSAGQDYDAKFIEYQNGGVCEYWIIDPRPDRLRTSFYVLDAQRRYRAVPVNDDGVYRSTVLTGLWFKVDWLWQDPLPAVDDLLLEIGGNAYAQHLIEQLRQRGLLPTL